MGHFNTPDFDETTVHGSENGRLSSLTPRVEAPK
jgi:hypothetical protein